MQRVAGMKVSASRRWWKATMEVLVKRLAKMVGTKRD